VLRDNANDHANEAKRTIKSNELHYFLYLEVLRTTQTPSLSRLIPSSLPDGFGNDGEAFKEGGENSPSSAGEEAQIKAYMNLPLSPPFLFHAEFLLSEADLQSGNSFLICKLSPVLRKEKHAKILGFKPPKYCSSKRLISPSLLCQYNFNIPLMSTGSRSS
jgi:hypothetical protein